MIFSTVITFLLKEMKASINAKVDFSVQLSVRQRHCAVIYWVRRRVDAVQFFNSFAEYCFLNKLRTFHVGHEF